MNKEFSEAVDVVERIADREPRTASVKDITRLCDAVADILSGISDGSHEMELAKHCMTTAYMVLSDRGAGHNDTLEKEVDELKYVLDRDLDIRR